MPAAAASRTSASGVDRPSEAVVWRWRSITPIAGGGRRGARRPWRATRLRYSRISRSRWSRSSSANSRKMRLPSDSSKRSPYLLKNWCDPRSQRMPTSSAWRSSTPFLSSSVPAANRPLAAPLKKRNVGCDSSVGIGGDELAVARPRACRGAPSPRRRAARTPCGRARRAPAARRACRTRGRCARWRSRCAARRARRRPRSGVAGRRWPAGRCWQSSHVP